MNTPRFLSPLLLALLVVGLTACDDGTSALEDDADANADVALSVDAAVSEDDGGFMDQLGDVADLATWGTIEDQTQGLAGKSAGSTITRTFDEAAMAWVITVERSFGEPGGPYRVEIDRTYRVQFRDADGIPRKFYITAGDTAHAMGFEITQGFGSVNRPGLEAKQTNVHGEWIVDGINTDTITINGTYHRDGQHTIKSDAANRTLTYNLKLQMTDLVGPRQGRGALTSKVSGTLHGGYEAVISFTKGDLYRDRELSRSVTVLIADGERTIFVDNTPFEGFSDAGRLLGPPDRQTP